MSTYIKLGMIKISAISGPTSFTLLIPRPNVPFYKHPLMLLGDHHDCRENLCDPETYDYTTVFTNTPLWFRLLDIYGSTKNPVQYFIEAYFPEEFLEDPYYFEKQNSKFMDRSSSISFMNYILKFHPECFIKSKTTNPNAQKCITHHINYEFAELRKTLKYINLKPLHKSEVKKQTESMLHNFKQSSPKISTIDKALNYIVKKVKDTDTIKNMDMTNPGRFKNWFVKKILEHEDQSKDGRIEYIDVEDNELYHFSIPTYLNNQIKTLPKHKSLAFPFYENALYDAISQHQMLLHYMEDNSTFLLSKEQYIQLLTTFCKKDFKACFDILINYDNIYFSSNSKLHNSIKNTAKCNANSQGDYDQTKQWLIQHVVKVYMIETWENITSDKKLMGLYKIIEPLLRLSSIYNDIVDNYLIASSEQLFQTNNDVEYQYKMKKYEKQYKEVRQYLSNCDSALSIIATLLFTPFNDLYVLLESWSSDVPLTVYNAGNDHIINLYQFLIKHNLYTPYVPIHDEDHIHCVSFNNLEKSIDIDDLIYKYQPDESRKKLHQLRLDVLLEPVFLEMMNGRSLDEHELFELASFQTYAQSENKTNHELLKDLDLQYITKIVPREYIKSRSSQFG